MNKYEILFDDIIKQTKSGLLSWKQIPRTANSDLIFSPGLVFRQFSTSLNRGGTDFKLLLVEKKYDEPDHDFLYDRYRPEILIVDEEGELVATLTDSVIERSDIIRLADMVEARNDKASKLFDSHI